MIAPKAIVEAPCRSGQQPR